MSIISIPIIIVDHMALYIHSKKLKCVFHTKSMLPVTCLITPCHWEHTFGMKYTLLFLL